jgi:predicted nucleotidyltransferase
MEEAVKREAILDFIRQNREYLSTHFHVRKIGLFGSFARGEQRPESDIDLIVEFEENTPDLFELKNELREFFGKRFHRKVNVARENYLKPYVRERVLSEVVYSEKW